MSDFHKLIAFGEMEDIRNMLEADPSLLEQPDPRGFPPIILASYNEQLELTRFFLDKGADVNAQDAAGNTALMGVCFKGYKPVAELLLERGADVNIRNYSGATALIFAATFGQVQLAKLLLERGADKSIEDVRGNKAVDHAKMQGLNDLAELLKIN